MWNLDNGKDNGLNQSVKKVPNILNTELQGFNKIKNC